MYSKFSVIFISLSLAACNNSINKSNFNTEKPDLINEYTVYSIDQNNIGLNIYHPSSNWFRYSSGVTLDGQVVISSIVSIGRINNHLLIIDNNGYLWLSNETTGDFYRVNVTIPSNNSQIFSSFDNVVILSDNQLFYYKDNNLEPISFYYKGKDKINIKLKSNDIIKVFNNNFYIFTDSNVLFSNNGSYWSEINANKTSKQLQDIFQLESNIYLTIDKQNNFYTGTIENYFKNNITFLDNKNKQLNGSVNIAVNNKLIFISNKKYTYIYDKNELSKTMSPKFTVNIDFKKIIFSNSQVYFILNDNSIHQLMSIENYFYLSDSLKNIKISTMNTRYFNIDNSLVIANVNTLGENNTKAKNSFNETVVVKDIKKGYADYFSLPIGSSLRIAGFAKYKNNAIILLNSGTVVKYNQNTSSILDNVIDYTTINKPKPAIFNGTKNNIISANSKYFCAIDVNGNIYISDNNDIKWKQLKSKNIHGNIGAISIKSISDNFYISVVLRGDLTHQTKIATYKTQTPEILSSWLITKQ